MKLKVLSLLVLSSVGQFSEASVTSASLFKEMQSTNPAVISGRTARALSFLAKKDSIEISQDLSTGPLGAGSKFDAEVELTNYSGFYGGKGGGPTLEIFAETGSGGRTNKIKEGSTVSENMTESTLTNLSVGMGLFEGFGLGLTKIAAEDKQQYNFTVNSQPVNVNTTFEYDLTALTAGISFNLGLDFGLFYRKGSLESKSATQADTKQGIDRVGAGVGLVSKVFRAEVGYVKDLNSIDSSIGKLSPTMMEFTVEGALGKLKLGYTGRYYQDGFFLLRGVLYNNLAFQTNNEDRLENTFNFAYGNDSKGHSISGAVSIGTVDSQEAQPFIANDTTKYKTTTKTQSFSLSYAYIF